MAKRWADIKKKKHSAAELAEIHEEIVHELLDMDFRAIREVLGKSQTEIAAVLETTQAQVSKQESRDDYLMSTLKRYVEALGGELEVTARFGDKSVRLRAAAA